MPYCIYLRKSRADSEAEMRGEGETLARHEKALTAFAKQSGLDVVAIYREIISGETIAARPQMQQLLSEVSEGLWDGVIVMDSAFVSFVPSTTILFHFVSAKSAGFVAPFWV